MKDLSLQWEEQKHRLNVFIPPEEEKGNDTFVDEGVLEGRRQPLVDGVLNLPLHQEEVMQI
jgi:hypothetical protein